MVSESGPSVLLLRAFYAAKELPHRVVGWDETTDG